MMCGFCFSQPRASLLTQLSSHHSARNADAGRVLSSQVSGLWLSGDEGMGKNMETTIMGYIGLP